MKLIVVIPTYDEAENLPAITAELLALPLDNLRIIIVDDNSPDGTGDIAEELAEAHIGRIIVTHRKRKLGLGTAYAHGFMMALNLGADVVVQMDADFSHAPNDVATLINKLDKYDVAVGSRYVEQGRTDERWSWWRYWLSWWANQVYTKMILGVKVQDSTAGFKAFRGSVLRAIDWGRVLSNGYVFQVEVAYICQKLGFRIVEVPIYFEDRRIGQSKMDVPVKLEAIWRVWQIRWRYRGLKAIH